MNNFGRCADYLFKLSASVAGIAVGIASFYSWWMSSYGRLVTWRQQHAIDGLGDTAAINWLFATALSPVYLIALLICWLADDPCLAQKKAWATSIVAANVATSLFLTRGFGETAGPQSPDIFPVYADPRIALCCEALIQLAIGGAWLLGRYDHSFISTSPRSGRFLNQPERPIHPSARGGW